MEWKLYISFLRNSFVRALHIFDKWHLKIEQVEIILEAKPDFIRHTTDFRKNLARPIVIYEFSDHLTHMAEDWFRILVSEKHSSKWDRNYRTIEKIKICFTFSRNTLRFSLKTLPDLEIKAPLLVQNWFVEIVPKRNEYLVLNLTIWPVS